MRRPGFPFAVTILALGFLALFLLYPLFGIFEASVLDLTGAHLTAGNYLRVLTRPFYQRALANSLAIGAAATAITTLIGVPLAFCLARLAIPGKPLLLALATLPLVLPSFVSAYALVLLLGRGGIVTHALRALGIPFESLYGAPGLVAVYTLTLFP
jgi:iron(III) transport system permease protein